MRALFLIAAAGVLTVVAALLGPAALAGEKPMGDECLARRPAGRQLHRELPLQPSRPRRPDRLPGKAGRLARAHVRRQPFDERVLDVRIASRGRTSCMRPADTAAYWVPALYHGSTLIAPAGRDDLLPARDARPGDDLPEQPAHDRGRCDRDDPAGRAGHVLELRRDVGRPALEHRADLPARGGARSSGCTCASRAAGTAGGSTAPTTRATWPTRWAGAARRRTPSRCPRSRRSTAIRVPQRCSAAPGSRWRRAASSAHMRTSSTRGSRRRSGTLVDDCLNALVHCGRGE